ncbi:MAG TPA: hypothetical protein VGA66_05945 [Mycobacterium sp.]|jgi:acyl-coenzyme A synthetase/AMP-(fatty) acid ligase
MSDNHTQAQSSYPPPADFASNANATGELYAAAEHDLSSLRLLGSVGEPINPDSQ